jgi:hypothetical protein
LTKNELNAYKCVGFMSANEQIRSLVNLNYSNYGLNPVDNLIASVGTLVGIRVSATATQKWLLIQENSEWIRRLPRRNGR